MYAIFHWYEYHLDNGIFGGGRGWLSSISMMYWFCSPRKYRWGSLSCGRVDGMVYKGDGYLLTVSISFPDLLRYQHIQT